MTNTTEKREKFIKLAEGRTQLALDGIRKIGNLSNKRAYEYSKDDIKKIIRALKEATADLERKFGASSDDGSNKFKL